MATFFSNFQKNKMISLPLASLTQNIELEILEMIFTLKHLLHPSSRLLDEMAELLTYCHKNAKLHNCLMNQL